MKFQIDKETEYFKKYEGNQKDADWDNEFWSHIMSLVGATLLGWTP